MDVSDIAGWTVWEAETGDRVYGSRILVALLLKVREMNQDKRDENEEDAFVIECRRPLGSFLLHSE